MYRAYFVDDEPLVLEEFANNPILEKYDYQSVGTSTSPVKAISDIRKQNPDVVFTDLMMPEMSGVDMMEKLRDKGSSCEFVVISAYPEFDEQRRFFLLDGFDYLLKPVADESLQQLLVRLTGKLASKREPLDSDVIEISSSPELNRAIEYMKENVASKHTLQSVSERCMTNPSYLCQLFANNLSTTFTAFLTRLRMEEAARLLKNTQKDVKEISSLCGYTDYFYFCKVFGKFFSCTPTAFREGAK